MKMASSPEQKSTAEYAKNLLSYCSKSVQVEEDFHFLRFEFLQRVNLVNLENDLVQIKSRMFGPEYMTNPQELHDLRNTLQQYATAIRDYQELQNKKSLDKDAARERKFRLHRYFHHQPGTGIDPWESHYSYFQDEHHHQQPTVFDPLRRALMEHLPRRLTFSQHERERREREYEEGQLPRELSKFVDVVARFVIAVTGGAAVVVPMIIMALGPSHVKTLVTVSVAVVVFSLFLSLGIRVSNVETLVSTATYAAVLVVFVGTNS